MAREYPSVNEMNYFTNRKLENEKGEKVGKILIWRLKGEEEYNIEMKCPFCEHIQSRKEIFERRPFRPVCEKCGKKVVIERMNTKKKK